MGLIKTAAGLGITLVIGGTVYTINQEDVVNNFAEDTGLTQQQAEQYVNSVGEEDLVAYDKLGSDFIEDGNEILSGATDIDCVNYDYEWVSVTLTCEQGKAQLIKIGNDEILLGNAYKKLDTDTANSADISNTIGRIDAVNADYDFEIVKKILDFSQISESKKSNSYNKATLQAALNSN
jgi:hypothetical protein